VATRDTCLRHAPLAPHLPPLPIPPRTNPRATKVEEVDEEVDEEPEAMLGVDQVINSIHAMTEEEREDFLTKAFAQKDF
jgi:hypothetical protein